MAIFVSRTLLLFGIFSLGHWNPARPNLSAQSPPVVLDTLEIQVGSRVSARLPVLTRSVQLFGRDEIRALPVRTVSELLEWATSVEVQARSPAQSDLGIRGGTFEQVVVLVNGVRVSDPQTGHFDLNLSVPLGQVERVEVLRGPSSALYGADAVGGVVNIVTANDPGGWVGRVEGGSWGSARVSVGGGIQGESGGSLSMGGEFSRSDGHRPGTDHETALLHLAVRRQVGEGKLKADFGLARRDFGAEDFYAPYPSFEKTRSYTSSFRWIGEGVDEWTLEVGSSFRRHEDEFTLIRDDPSVYQNRHTSSQVGGDVVARTQSWKDWRIALGGELFRDILRSNSLGDREETRGALFGEAVLGGAGRGVVSLGIRQDWHQGFGSFLSPSISGSLRFGEIARGRAALGRSFRAPTWTERYYQDPVNRGQEDLRPEEVWSGEVGLDLFPQGGFKLSVTGFARKAEALIDWARPESAQAPGGTPLPPWETRNVEEATFQGLEAEFSGQGPMGTHWSLGGMWLSVDSKEAHGFVSKYALRPLKEQINLVLDRSFGTDLSFGLNLRRGRRGGEDVYHRLDARGRLRIGPNWLYLDATNLLGEDYPDITGAIAPGRALFLGLEIGSRREEGG